MRDWISRWGISQKIVASFIVLIIIGTFLLSLPVSQHLGSQSTYFDHFFHAASLVTVTGLVDTPIAHTYSFFGAGDLFNFNANWWVRNYDHCS